MALTILHLSDGSLPDWRIEKAAISSKNKGYQVYFAGIRPSFNYNRKIFHKTFDLSWNPKTRYKFPYEWHILKKQMTKVIKEVRPDIIHAHNVFSAQMVSEIDTFPLVYDNHEYWSKYLIYQYEDNYNNTDISNTRNRLRQNISKFMNNIKKNIRKMWIKWELDIVVDAPTLVPSRSISSELSLIAKKVFILPNFPLRSEIEFISTPEKCKKFSSVYAGTAPYLGHQTPIKNVDGFITLFNNEDMGELNVIGWKSNDLKNIVFHGFLDRMEMITEMSKSCIGIIPWKKHPFHQYCSPNKAYEYAHAGLVVFSINSLKPIFDELQNNAIGFDNYKEMIDQIKYFQSNTNELFNRRLKTYEFARNNLLWERYEKNIFDAYNVA